MLALVTAVGAIAAGAIGYRCGGLRGFALVVVLHAALAASVMTPLLRQPAAWSPPPDIEGVTTATMLLLSVLAAVPGLVAGLAYGARVRTRPGSSVSMLVAAGAYYLTCLLMSLPTPQLDLRYALPYGASFQADAWRLVVVGVPALAAGLALASRGGVVWKGVLLGVIVGLAGAAPVEITRLALGPAPYWAVSLVSVPIASAVIVSAVVFGRRVFPRPRWSRLETWSPRVAMTVGAGAAVAILVAWSLLSTMPTPADRMTRLDAYRETGDERKVVACVTAGRGEELRRPSAREDERSVTLFVQLRRSPTWYASDLVGIRLPVVITLHDPLGPRAVLDGSTGERVPGSPAGTSGFC